MATRNLYWGCTGDDVKTLQANLNSLGFNCGAVDGSFGQMTYNAVVAFQRSCSIIVDGIAGPQTRAAMDGKLKAKASVVISAQMISPAAVKITKEIGRWNGHQFIVSPALIYSFTDLTIKGSSELQSKDDSEQGYVSRKGSNPIEVTLTVRLNAMTGCDVRKEAMAFVDDASNGSRDHFYVGNSKLVSSILMLTDAQVKEVEIAGDGKTWVRADVALTMKQCNAYDTAASSSSASSYSSAGGSSGYSSYTGSSQKVSVKSTTPVTVKGVVTDEQLATKYKSGDSVLGSYVAQYKAMKSGTSTTSTKKVTVKVAKSTSSSAGGSKWVATTK